MPRLLLVLVLLPLTAAAAPVPKSLKQPPPADRLLVGTWQRVGGGERWALTVTADRAGTLRQATTRGMKLIVFSYPVQVVGADHGHPLGGIASRAKFGDGVLWVTGLTADAVELEGPGGEVVRCERVTEK